MSAHPPLAPAVAAEFAARDLRFWNAELDRQLAEMRKDADFLDEHGEHFGATMLRHGLERVEASLGHVRQAAAALADTGHAATTF